MDWTTVERARRDLHQVRPVVIRGDHELDGCWALDRMSESSSSHGPVRVLLDVVREYPMHRSSAAIAARMVDVLRRFEWPDDLVVVPVPTNELADVLARAVASLLEVPYERVLRHRGNGVGNTPRLAVKGKQVPANVLLIDDMVHTGLTLRMCARALGERGAVGVWAMVAAIEERRHDERRADERRAVERRAEAVEHDERRHDQRRHDERRHDERRHEDTRVSTR
ncbi:MAG: phosphoribosyltransferase [Acidimicrobiales bacterium]